MLQNVTTFVFKKVTTKTVLVNPTTSCLLPLLVPNLVSVTHLSLQILGKLRLGISIFWNSAQSLIKEKCHNSRTSNDIDMKLGPLLKLGKRNTMSKKKKKKKNDNDIISANCEVIVIFMIYQSGAIWKFNFGCMICKTFSLIETF